MIDEGLSLSVEYLSRGIGLVEDMGHKNGLGWEFKKKTNRGKAGLLTIRTAGQALYKKGTYGGFLGKGVSGEQEIRTAIKIIAEAGADFLKIINSGIVSLQGACPVTEGGFSDEEWKVIQEEARKRGLKIRCHANGDPLIQQALAFGVSSIEHGFFVSKETLHGMVERKVSWTPTGFALLSLKPFFPREEQFHIEKIVDNHLKAVYDGASIGVTLRVGTDSGSKGVEPGKSFFKELQLFKQAGLSMNQILSAACLDWKEIEKGNYLLAKKNFIALEKVEALFINGLGVDGGQAPQPNAYG
jgi:imidazolonepropionase-like amidohydrolase